MVLDALFLGYVLGGRVGPELELKILGFGEPGLHAGDPLGLGSVQVQEPVCQLRGDESPHGKRDHERDRGRECQHEGGPSKGARRRCRDNGRAVCPLVLTRSGQPFVNALANCIGGDVVPRNFDHQLGIEAATFLRHAEAPLNTNKQVAPDAFQHYKFSGNLPQHLRALEGRVLSRWGDAGWGHVVADGKHDNHFPDELVAAAAKMILERWSPEPRPEWVTSVPSRNHPELVPDFAARLADALGLPFLPVVEKVLDNEPQKMQQNRFHRCRNLDGAFEVSDNDLPNGPVLLVDDVYDSGWTMTVVAALLKQAGSGSVLPLALADSSSGS